MKKYIYMLIGAAFFPILFWLGGYNYEQRDPTLAFIFINFCILGGLGYYVGNLVDNNE